MKIIKSYGEKLILKELKKSYNFFIKEANLNKNSKGYGLVRDKTLLANHIASIASVGYGLGALVIGVEHKWIKYSDAYNRANRTLDTFINSVEGKNGFYYHFVNMETGKREWNCELSIIDTGIFICGAITAGEYFGGEVKEKAEELYKRINWEWYRNKDTNYFYMGYSPEKGFWGKWDMYAEQLMLYVLGVSSPTFPIDKSMYYEFIRERSNYKDIKDIIYTYCGTLFTYQFSHAWIDFRNKKDLDGIDWFENSIKATKANREYCMDNMKNYKTYGPNSWGLTACLGPKEYSGGYGAKPCKTDLEIENDGTVAPCGAIGSIVFTPKESIEAMEYLYNTFPKLWGRYGFKDGYNLDGEKPWFAKEYIGIDKGIEILMIENYLNGTIWKYFMKNKYVQEGLEKLGICKQEIAKVNN
ncbi:MAG: hypothetical protein HFJ57_02400 [Clostridia bacterium]|nr:hypothetical protein [Clostridia bacterium]